MRRTRKCVKCPLIYQTLFQTADREQLRNEEAVAEEQAIRSHHMARMAALKDRDARTEAAFQIAAYEMQHAEKVANIRAELQQAIREIEERCRAEEEKLVSKKTPQPRAIITPQKESILLRKTKTPIRNEILSVEHPVAQKSAKSHRRLGLSSVFSRTTAASTSHTESVEKFEEVSRFGGSTPNRVPLGVSTPARSRQTDSSDEDIVHRSYTPRRFNASNTPGSAKSPGRALLMQALKGKAAKSKSPTRQTPGPPAATVRENSPLTRVPGAGGLTSALRKLNLSESVKKADAGKRIAPGEAPAASRGRSVEGRKEKAKQKHSIVSH
eukprot:GHVN01000947.1.p1 GENE.GHVN01000947.1~~GHVN01000947.1.p1  ORF type:complete len:326 (+),score=36.13 GHVN01000947.1:1860-2837(+)